MAAAAAAAGTAAEHSSSGSSGASAAVVLPLRTRGRDIVDGAGQRVRLRCTAWSGAQEKWFVPSGLHQQTPSRIAALAAAGGFNCIRLVWSTEMALRSANGSAVVPRQALAANPELQGKSPLQVLDAVVAAIAAQGLLVILDNHSSDAIWCCSLSDGNGLWYTASWSEADWLAGWALMARRYANTSAVIGAGLRNEPRPALIGSKFVVPTWGSNNSASDFALAYEKAAAAVLSARPNTLMFAQGLTAGRDLRPVRSRPLVLRAGWPAGRVVSNQLVYETHEYPWLWGSFNFSNYREFAGRLDSAWGFVSAEGIAPVWVGEFGIAHTAEGTSSAWWQATLRYIRERDLDWSYWLLDGQQGPSREFGAEETYGLLNTTWSGYAYQPLLQQLRSIM